MKANLKKIGFSLMGISFPVKYILVYSGHVGLGFVISLLLYYIGSGLVFREFYIENNKELLKSFSVVIGSYIASQIFLIFGKQSLILLLFYFFFYLLYLIYFYRFSKQYIKKTVEEFNYWFIMLLVMSFMIFDLTFLIYFYLAKVSKSLTDGSKVP
ncbi:hypothetical protein [Desulfurobacterium sp.]|uniref:hypothetical protein n=1 Tax=Desulfurobacterium sp. TaxID=2004706 RepID=UPI00260513DA|nr:hypothetical protein [Desulfurobacterium sp.]